MRSVVVVLPASICAMMPIFRVFASRVSASVAPGLVAVAVLIAFLELELAEFVMPSDGQSVVALRSIAIRPASDRRLSFVG
jgi:hypothetical protein